MVVTNVCPTGGPACLSKDTLKKQSSMGSRRCLKWQEASALEICWEPVINDEMGKKRGLQKSILQLHTYREGRLRCGRAVCMVNVVALCIRIWGAYASTCEN